MIKREPKMPEEGEKETKITVFSDTDSNSGSDSDHDLSYYISDRIKLIRKIFKVLKTKRIVRMAPECLKNIPEPEMKSLLLEELMGISNKRLAAVIHDLVSDKPKEASSSSSESEHQRSKVMNNDTGIISLDDITDDDSVTGLVDDDNCMEIELSERERLELEVECPEKNLKQKGKKAKHLKHGKKKRKKIHIKKEPLEKIIVKQELLEALTNHEEIISKQVVQEEPVMSALNLLELQARARAIRSQLKSEVENLTQNPVEEGDKANDVVVKNGPDSPNSVVVVSPEHDVVNVSSHSEPEQEGEKKKKGSTKKSAYATKKGSAATSSNIEEDLDNDNDVLIMNVTQDDDFDKEIANMPIKSESTDK